MCMYDKTKDKVWQFFDPNKIYLLPLYILESHIIGNQTHKEHIDQNYLHGSQTYIIYSCDLRS